MILQWMSSTHTLDSLEILCLIYGTVVDNDDFTKVILTVSEIRSSGLILSIVCLELAGFADVVMLQKRGSVDLCV